MALVVFDLGRVLVRLCDGWLHACAVAGVTPPTGGVSARAAAALNEMVCAYEVGAVDLQGFSDALAPDLGMAAADIRALSNVYLRGLYPGAVQLLDDLRAAGIATACLSNTNANHWQQMCEVAGPNYLPFDSLTYTFASHLLRLRKPDERIYAHVEQATGTPPEKIVFFDDVEENIFAATKRGWQAHPIRTDADPIAQARRRLSRCGLLNPDASGGYARPGDVAAARDPA